MFFTPVSSTAQPFDVNKMKLWSISKIISAQSDLVDYERGLRASQFVDCEEVDVGRIASCELSSQHTENSRAHRLLALYTRGLFPDSTGISARGAMSMIMIHVHSRC